MTKRYRFHVILSGVGPTEEEAWADAVDQFCEDPGEPDSAVDITSPCEFDEEGEELAESKPPASDWRVTWTIDIAKSDAATAEEAATVAYMTMLGVGTGPDDACVFDVDGQSVDLSTLGMED